MSNSYYISVTKNSPKVKVAEFTYRDYLKFFGFDPDRLVSFEHELLYGHIEDRPVYYMRDNHTFKELTGSIDNMLSQIKEEFDDGYTHGMLCSHTKKSCVHLAGELKVDECTIWLKAFLDD